MGFLRFVDGQYVAQGRQRAKADRAKMFAAFARAFDSWRSPPLPRAVCAGPPLPRRRRPTWRPAVSHGRPNSMPRPRPRMVIAREGRAERDDDGGGGGGGDGDGPPGESLLRRAVGIFGEEKLANIVGYSPHAVHRSLSGSIPRRMVAAILALLAGRRP